MHLYVCVYVHVRVCVLCQRVLYEVHVSDPEPDPLLLALNLLA
jgi:hypothetical protein